MPNLTVDSSLSGFTEGDATARLVKAVLAVIPGAPALTPYGSLAQAQAALYADLPADAAARAAAHAAEPGALRALEVAEYIDRGDAGIAALSGATAAFRFFFGNKQAALDTDPQQGADAALKALALAYVIHQLVPGALADKVKLLRSTEAGEALLTWYAAAEIALPFTDDALVAGGSAVASLVEKYGAGHAARLDLVGGAGSGTRATEMLGELAAPLDHVIGNVRQYTHQIVDSARPYLPAAIAAVGTVAGAAATAADAMPVYRYLIGRLAAEIALVRCRA